MKSLMSYAHDYPVRAALLVVTAVITGIILIGWVIIPLVMAFLSWLIGWFIKTILIIGLIAAVYEWIEGKN